MGDLIAKERTLSNNQMKEDKRSENGELVK